MKGNGFFVTGTDTGTGKTTVSCGLLQAANGHGLATAAMKPVAAGCPDSSAGRHHEDALLLQQYMSVELEYSRINPFALKAPVSPHLAAERDGITIDLDRIAKLYRQITQLADFVIVEGIGGWQTPLSEQRTVADLAYILGLPVILVVSIRLGCLNHALLTYESIIADKLPVAGWVANLNSQRELCVEENIETLEMRLPAPCLGRIPFVQSADARLIAGHLDLKKLL